ncbi:energy-coupling factor transporter transmembrane component T family protein [Spiroplasma alleghenense]|uniref:Cobalt ABC transporter permease n=1 Tax=Spiroplasma alleghenense TaxID=216931 RepID=A0A345Z360_9MOLU|nr:energy-coupling factor transporter transmembrane component T [Spiroplasma alleghenense]AXK51039.1 cobalt ABC transporter permease [Spiroplasma alleghenense]
MRMVFGRYMPYNSVIHRMDPRLKLFMILAMILALFFPVGFTGFAFLIVLIMTIFTMSKLKYSMLLKLLRPIIFMFLVVFIFNIFIARPSSDPANILTNWTQLGAGFSYGLFKDYGYTLRIWNIYLSEYVIYSSIMLSLRIFLMITCTTILTGTTQPLELTLAIEDLLFPLRIIGIPVYIFSTIISIALRMIPTLIDEAGRIMKAQASRGIDIKNGHFKDKVKGMTSLIIPLLVSSFQKAEDLAFAMDSRGYDPHAKRTRYRQVKFQIIDIFIFLITLTVVSLVIAYAFSSVLRTFYIPRIDGILYKDFSRW